MIDTNIMRAKAVDAAVKGELTADFESISTADNDLKKLEIIFKDVLNEEIPYKLKDGWRWVRVVNLGADSKNSFADGPFGSNLKKEHYTTEKQVRIIQLSNVGELGWKDDNEKYTTFEHLETIKRSEVEVGNIVIAKMMPAGRAIIVPDVSKAYVLSSDCVKFVPKVGLNVRYLCYAINSQMFRKQVLKDVHGIGRERTSLSKLKSYLLPIPPLDEQNVIVERINVIFELLKKIDEIQCKYNNDLEVLKSKIIDAGIRGKLTEQLLEDGDAETLYDQIQEEKAKLIKEGKIKKEKPLPEIQEDEIPFEIPKNWKWVRLQELVSMLGDGIHGTPKYDENGEYFFVNGNNLVGGKILIKPTTKRINEDEYKKYKKELTENTVLVSINGTLGNLAFYNSERIILGKSACYFNLLDGGLKEYIYYVLKSDYFLRYANNSATGVTIKNVSLKAMNELYIPLPPLLEQKRIVKRITQLLNS